MPTGLWLSRQQVQYPGRLGRGAGIHRARVPGALLPWGLVR